ncbi:phosphatidylcholine and lysophosphatidylcholine phospholipase, partial [Oleoguttula sp. CCFEE 5521]
MASLQATGGHASAAMSSSLSASIPSTTTSTTTTQSTSSMLGGLLLGIFTIIPSLLYWIVTFVTITIPTWLFSFLSKSFTLTLNMTTLLILVLALVSTVSWFVRYRFLNMYSRLPPEPQRKEPQVEVFPESQDQDTKPGLANYFDEFLSAIKVFGYLERPVFHELTRTMQTRKLIAGETLLLEEEKGYCLVVDGLVQIFVKSNRTSSPDDTGDDSAVEDGSGEDGAGANRRYQLLTEVRNGAPMSSLFSILALFTENVKLRHGDEDETLETDSAPHLQTRFPGMSIDGTLTPESGAPSPAAWNGSFSHREPRKRRSSTLAAGTASGILRDPPHLALDTSHEELREDSSRTPSTAGFSRRRFKKAAKSASAHPDIVARATVDTTIAIIPATA